MRIDTGAIRVEVRDGGAGLRARHAEPRGADGGFGLFLVERMATAGASTRSDGTRVWFELEACPAGG